jgi:ketosteroid isomerase-like protein
MKNLTVFLIIVVLSTLTSCGSEEIEVTREVEVTRIVKETVIETVVETEASTFNAEAEREAVISAYLTTADAIARGDWNTWLAYAHKDLTGFETWEDEDYALTRADFTGPDMPTINEALKDYDVIVTPDLAVIRGYESIQVPPDPGQDMYMTAVYKKENGQWLLIHAHSSYIH